MNKLTECYNKNTTNRKHIYEQYTIYRDKGKLLFKI